MAKHFFASLMSSNKQTLFISQIHNLPVKNLSLYFLFFILRNCRSRIYLFEAFSSHNFKKKKKIGTKSENRLLTNSCIKVLKWHWWKEKGKRWSNDDSKTGCYHSKRGEGVEIIRFIRTTVEVVILTNKTLLFMQIWHHLVAFLFLLLMLISNLTHICISVIISLIEKTILVALLIDLIISILDYIIIFFLNSDWIWAIPKPNLINSGMDRTQIDYVHPLLIWWYPIFLDWIKLDTHYPIGLAIPTIIGACNCGQQRERKSHY